MAQDVFPATMMTWIDARLQEGEAGRGDLNQHIMSVYAWPLRVYFLGSRDRWLGDPDEVIQGFLADRLGKPGFFDEWRKSGMRLRRWMINAFCFYLKELRRKRQRFDAVEPLGAESTSPSGNPEQEFDRAYVVSLIRRALQETQKVCEGEGLADHWRIFLLHYYQEQPYAGFADDFGVDPPRAAVMARTAQRKFRSVLRDLVARDGSAEDLDGEIRILLEGIGP